MELTYHRKGDYLFPNLVIKNEETEVIGKYGLLRKSFLKEHKTNWYKSMLLTGKLDHHLAEIDKAAQERLDLIVNQMLLTNPAPDKETNQMGWAAHMNSLAAMAEEIVLKELVYN